MASKTVSVCLLSTLNLSPQELQGVLNNCVFSVFHLLFDIAEVPAECEPHPNPQYCTMSASTAIIMLPFDTKVLLFATATQIFWQLFSTSTCSKHEYPVVMSVVSLLIANKVLDLVVQPSKIFELYGLLNSTVTEETTSSANVEIIDQTALSRLMYELELEALVSIDIRVYTVNHVQQVLSLLSENLSGKELHTARCVLLCVIMSPKKLVNEYELVGKVTAITTALHSCTNHSTQYSTISAFPELDAVLLEQLWHTFYVLKL